MKNKNETQMSRKEFKKGLKAMLDLWETGGQEALERVIENGAGRATRQQIETVDRWIEETGFKTFEEIREKCREVAQGDWTVERQLRQSQGIR